MMELRRAFQSWCELILIYKDAKVARLVLAMLMTVNKKGEPGE